MDTLARIKGTLLGLAVGDALGFPTEFRKRAHILQAFGPDGVTGFVAQQDARFGNKPFIAGRAHPPGTYSDDTQMSIAVAEALIEAGHEDLDTLMTSMARHFVAWANSSDNNRAPGGTCMTGCRNLGNGVPWRKAGVADSKGCGSAMRVAPIGLYFADDRRRLLDVARASSVLTHGHDAGVEGAAAAALIVALAMRGETPELIYDDVMRECAPRSKDFSNCMERLPRMIEVPPEIALSKTGLGEAWVAEEAVASALYCFWRTPASFVSTVLTGANTDGDSDSIACIAGSFSGARHGAAGIPEKWRREVENSAMLGSLAERLHDASL